MRRLSFERVISRLEKSYNGFKDSVVDANAECIVINAEAGLEDRNGNEIFDYWTTSGLYAIGVIEHLDRWVKRNGWWFQWENAGVIKLYPLD